MREFCLIWRNKSNRSHQYAALLHDLTPQKTSDEQRNCQIRPSVMSEKKVWVKI